MAIIYIAFAIILIVLLCDFKKGVLLYAPMKLFFNLNVRFGALTFDLAMTAIIILLFLLKRKKLQDCPFSMSKYFILYSIGYIITCLYPDYSPNFIPRIVVTVLGFSWVYFYCLQNKKDIRFAIFSYAVFAIIMCGNGLLQPMMNINPLDDYLQSISDQNNSMFLDNGWLRQGRVRYRSFIPHAISYGVASCIIFYLLLWHYFVDKRKSIFRIIVLVSLGFSFSGIIICGSRTPILGLLPLAYILLNKKYVSSTVRWRFVLLVVAVMFVEMDYVLYSVESLINPKLAEDAGGSSTDMRLSQFAIAIGWMMENPFFGKGMSFDAYMANSDILGGESVWLPLIMNNGLVGLVSYIIVCWGTYKVFAKSPGKIFLLIFSIGWIVMRTATSLIGVTDAQFFTCMFVIYRYYQLTSNQNVTTV